MLKMECPLRRRLLDTLQPLLQMKIGPYFPVWVINGLQKIFWDQAGLGLVHFTRVTSRDHKKLRHGSQVAHDGSQMAHADSREDRRHARGGPLVYIPPPLLLRWSLWMSVLVFLISFDSLIIFLTSSWCAEFFFQIHSQLTKVCHHSKSSSLHHGNTWKSHDYSGCFAYKCFWP